MINVNDFKTGMTISYENNLYHTKNFSEVRDELVSLALESGITLIISATLMSVCILLSFIEKGRSKNSESWK